MRLPLDALNELPERQGQCDHRHLIHYSPGCRLHGHEIWQGGGSLIPPDRQPVANDIGVDAAPDGNAGKRGSQLQALLHDLGFERFWIRPLFAHGILAIRAIASPKK
jgi:hypothetical protein